MSDSDDLPLFGNLSDEELDEEGEGTFKERERSEAEQRLRLMISP
jgi:hypothetical protein